MYSRGVLFVGWTCAAFLWIPLVAFAQTAGMLSFQGLIKDSGGNPIAAPVNLEFRIFDAPTGGTLKGGPYGPVNVTPANGIVSTSFGPVLPNVFDGAPRWLEVSVDGSALPRIEMATAPAAAEQVNRPGSGTPAIQVSTGGTVDIVLGAPGEPAGLHIDSDGHVGIGTADPGEQLTVDGVFGIFGPGLDGSVYERGTIQADTTYDFLFEAPVSGSNKRPFIFSHRGDGVIRANMIISADQGGAIELGATNANANPVLGGRPFIDFHYGTGTVQDYNVRIINDATNQLTFAASTTYCTGSASVDVLHIRGGADLAEKFPASEALEPGMVVVIDPDEPGQLKLARDAYDRKVAGIVSGANDFPAGAILGNLPGHEDTPPIALAGRVWCWCDAMSGAITPGDLLTTSATAGHAMRAQDDRDLPRGCVIGKAMSELKEGRGLVLVLVQPQ